MKVFALVTLMAIAVSAQQDCTPLRCTLPKKEGTCSDSIASFYFDNTAKQCKPFTYTGCGGNVNRFRTLQLCQNTCLKDRPNCTPGTSTTSRPTTRTTTRTTTKRTTTKPTTTTKATTTTKRTTTTGSTTTTKRTTASSGTTTKPTTTTTRATTTTRRTTNGPTSKPPVRCTLKLDPGTCTSAIPRFYFDSASGQCKTFNYSGCGGNVNNFRSKELCEEICLGA